MNVAIGRLSETQRLRYLCALNALDKRMAHNQRQMAKAAQLVTDVNEATRGAGAAERLQKVYHRIRALK